ncbi:MAG TPA: hypothetical protein VGD54_06755 [Steroidobacteraceae bacterium]
MKPQIAAISLSLLIAAAYAQSLSSSESRLTRSEVDGLAAHNAGAGTSGVTGIRTTVVASHIPIATVAPP